MGTEFSKGDKVEWSWGSGTATGEVTEVFTSKVTRTIKGNEVTRNASEDEPAYMVEQEDGDRALKSGSELSKASGASDDGMTKQELYEKAKEQDIDGRSRMDKAELKDAVEG